VAGFVISFGTRPYRDTETVELENSPRSKRCCGRKGRVERGEWREVSIAEDAGKRLIKGKEKKGKNRRCTGF
jgi:hypothetical protein